MSRLFPELDEASGGEAVGERVADELAPAAPQASEADAGRGARGRSAVELFDRALGLPGRFTVGGPCHVQGVELAGPGRLTLHVGGGVVPPCTIYVLEGRAERTMATTPHLSFMVRGSEVNRAVELLVRQAAARLQAVKFAELERLAASDPQVARSRGAPVAQGLPGASWPPTDLDVEYLNSLGFGYSPPDAWRNFMQGHENNYGGIENSRGYCQRVVGDVVNVNHTEIECFYSSPTHHNGSASFWSHAKPDFDARAAEEGEHVELFSDLDENDVIKGGQRKLDRVLGSIVDAGKRPDSVVITSTCTTTVIGDDVGGSVERVKRRAPLPVVSMAVSRDVKQTIFERVRAQPGFAAAARRAGYVNLVGLPQLVGQAQLIDLLAEGGVRVNAWLLPTIDAKGLEGYLAAELQVLHDWPFLDETYRTLLEGIELPSIKPPVPVGLDGVRGWVRAIGEATGRVEQLEAALARRLERVRPAWERLAREASGYRLGFVGEERAIVRFFSTRQVLGLPVLQLLEEMGFGLDFVLVRSRATRPTRDWVTRGTRRTRYVETADELEHELRTGEAAAYYSEISCDRRVTRCGKNLFSLNDFGRLGLEGSLEALERMVEVCRLPFFRTYAAYLGAPFATGHVDPDELAAAAGGGSR